MTLAEARENVGRRVAYVANAADIECGVITSVNSAYVFVRYDGDAGAKATVPADLVLEPALRATASS